MIRKENSNKVFYSAIILMQSFNLTLDLELILAQDFKIQNFKIAPIRFRI